MDVRIAMVQPHTDPEAGEKNVDEAVTYISLAAAEGAQIVCLPETYPGPWRLPVDYDPMPRLRRAAEEHSVYVIGGLIEPVANGSEAHYDALVLIGPSGEVVGRYRRLVPSGPWIYRGGSFWDFDYTPGDELPVFDTDYGKIGLLVCSEVYVPELSRILAVKGAEIIFMPAGMWKGPQWPNWRTLMHARAIENLAYTATCQNITGDEPMLPGLAMICSPEEVVAESTGTGVLVGDCDLSRLRMLRSEQDGPSFPGRKACKAGVLWQWYKPDLFEKLT